MRIRNLVLLCGGGALIAAVVVLLVAGLTGSPRPGTATPAIAASPPVSTPSYDPSAGDAASDDEAPAEVREDVWGPVVDNFARNFTNTAGGAGAWRQRLTGNPTHPNVTSAVSAQLRTVDVRNVPVGHYTGHQLLKSSSYELGVKVSYREGWAMVLYLNTDGTTWQIYAYDKWEP